MPDRLRSLVTVVGLGPGDPALLTAETLAAIERIPTRFVRTERHPSAAAVAPAESFDAVYQTAETLEDVYRTIAHRVAAAAGGAPAGEVLYAVPGSPMVAERTVSLLLADPAIEVRLLPALSFLDLAWARLGIDPVGAGAKLVDGHRFAVEAADQTGPLLVAQCDSPVVLSDIKLAVEHGPVVHVLQRLGLPDERVSSVAWDELDRAVVPDHLTCLWIPELAEPVAAEVTRLAELTRTLRARCPWDRAQTHQTLTRHLIEEAYEVVEAIDELGQGPSGPSSGEQGPSGPSSGEQGPSGPSSGEQGPSGYAHLEEELGDLLFQVVLHATLAAEAGQFTLTDVTVGIHDKLVARHPHVFGDADPEDAAANWEQAKMAEKGRSSVLDGVTAGLPALLHAAKVQRRAASVGFDWENVDGAWPKVVEELRELEEALGASPGGGPAVIGGRVAAQGRISEELGDLLFAVVNVARHLDIDAETALRHGTAKFADRFRRIEARAGGARLSLREWDALWEEAKRQSR